MKIVTCLDQRDTTLKTNKYADVCRKSKKKHFLN